ncbi:MAG: nicotinate-nucleotide adenylyltransferase [Halobacteriovoraceae bacterium]|nr:nicotinate-nucleotide adenylyltransferase [Halobacteriovoraceae bacterium]|tara:strand:- start:17134 stop:18543 length:1410 start_codon:yes stop_codon:yes gene_type:complete
MSEFQNIKHKALKLNLDDSIYGTFAEIGAGQEVAANFFKAGAASGTIAKSISAYDMTFSDSIYGKEPSGRYVCQSRVEKMINYEYDLIQERLGPKHPDRRFFAYANTVVARNYHGTNSPNGWLGVRFQKNPGDDPSDLILHIRMHDHTTIQQARAIGVLGVNMLHACYYRCDSISNLVHELMEHLSTESIEIDMVETRGPAFSHIDNRLLNLELIVQSITDAVMFDEKGQVRLAKDELYKKNIMLTRGSFRPPTKVNVNILETGLSNFKKDIHEEEVVSLAEITINHLKEDGAITSDDFLARVDLLASIGQKVLVTNMPQFYRLTNYLSTFKPKQIALVLGVYNFMQVFDENYTSLDGGILEALGCLFKPNVTIYLCPYKEEEKGVLISLNNVEVNKKNEHLLDHIKDNGQVKNLEGVNEKILHIYSRKVLDMIRSSEEGWEELVPTVIADTINAKCLFGHPCDHKQGS